ncbi:TPA: helix-turn-helix domain-containing protein [Burkholderia vietnamiensis]|nr:helix-turn-helix domain-containing protein [Burkholderia vietnamiensis]
MELKDWIRASRNGAKLTQEQLGERLGVTKGNVSAWENGRHEPSYAQLQQIAEITGATLPHGTSHETKGSSESTYNIPAAGDNFVMGPDLKSRLYPEISWVQAGMWTELCENFVPDEGTAWHQCHIDLGPCGFVVAVRGPSMTAPAGVSPSFPDGIKLFVSPDAEVLPGKFVVALRDGKATFKKLSLIDGDLYLEAINPDWPERYTKLGDGDHFAGVVRHAGFDV